LAENSDDDPGVEARFINLWNNVGRPEFFGESSINLNQFMAITALIINETTHITGIPEAAGNLSYYFEDRPQHGSYNTNTFNTPAHTLFRDEHFLAAHGRLNPTEPRIRNLPAWSGSSWPAGVSNAINYSTNGFIMQADFYKFRGRGLNQTTGRGNYKMVILAVSQYSGDNGTLVSFRNIVRDICGARPIPSSFEPATWRGSLIEEVATKVSDDQLNTLFSPDDQLAQLFTMISYFRGKAIIRGNAFSLSIPQGGLNSPQVQRALRDLATVQGGADYVPKFTNRVSEFRSKLRDSMRRFSRQTITT